MATHKKPTLKSLFQRHSRARSAANAAFWQLFDTPAARRAEVNSAAGPFFALQLRSHSEIDVAAAEFAAACKKEGRYGSNGCGPKLKPEHLEEIAAISARLHAVLNTAIDAEVQANIANGRIAAELADHKTRDAFNRAMTELCRFVRDRATPREVGAFANYILAAANNDFEFHLTERSKRHGKKTGLTCDFLSSNWDDSMRALRVVQQALAPHPTSNRAKARAKARK